VLALRGMRPPRFVGLFEAFANVMPFQQLSLDAAGRESRDEEPHPCRFGVKRGNKQLD